MKNEEQIRNILNSEIDYVKKHKEMMSDFGKGNSIGVIAILRWILDITDDYNYEGL